MNQHKKHAHDKKSHNIHHQPHETRDALHKDIKAIAQNFSPDHVKEEAKGMNEAKETVVDTLVEAKDTAVETLVEAKDKLVETRDVAVEKLAEAKDVVAETLSEAKDATMEKLRDYKEVAAHALSNVGEQARRAGDASWSFARQNALPLTLIGIGASWLIGGGRRSAGSDDAHDARPKLSARPRESKSARRPSLRARYEDGADSLGASSDSAAQSATRQVSELAARAGEKAMDAYGRAEHAVLGGAAQGREFAAHQLARARDGSREFIQENPLAVGAMALATGIGIGLLIPSTEPENALYGATRDRLVGEAREAAASVREAAQSVATVAKETASSLV
jgi:ElaB/YqjD/DUF883 family membrane-anchored ribosome-binding protein